MEGKTLILVLMMLIVSMAVFAQENATNSTDVNTTQPAPVVNQTPSEPVNVTPENQTVQVTPQKNQTPKEEPKEFPKEPVKLIKDFRMSRIFPTSIKVGETQLNVEITNTGTAPLENVGAIVTGKGIAVTDIVPIDRLDPGQQAYIIVFMTASQGGTIPLSIRVQNKEFKANIQVVDVASSINEVKRKQEEQKQKQKAEALDTQLDNLTAIYEAYDHEYVQKITQGYVFTELSFQDAKSYLRQGQANLAKGDLVNGEASLLLVQSELDQIRKHLDAGRIQEKTWKDTLRDNIPWIAATASTIVALFAIIENVKKHQGAIVSLASEPKHAKKKKKKAKQKESPKEEPSNPPAPQKEEE